MSRKLRAGALVALAAIAAVPAALPLARAQLALPSSTFPLPAPSTDSNPQSAPAFPRQVQPDADTQSSAADADNSTANGAGTTGFDPNNVLGKKRTTTKPGAAVQSAPVPVIPPTAISAARLPQNRNRTRHGTPGASANANANTNVNATANVNAIANPGANDGAAPVPPLPGSVPDALLGPDALNDPALIDPSLLPRPLIRRPAVDDQPFDPTGIHAGSFILRPAIEFTAGYDTNPARTPVGGGASDFAIVAPELQAASDWERHQLTVDLRSSYTTYGAQPSLDRPFVDGKIDGRIDVSKLTRIDLEGRTLISTDNPGSPNIQAGLERLPVFADVGGSIGFGQRFNRLDVEIKEGLDRTTYQRSTFTDGEKETNDDRNFDQYATQLRAVYDLEPSVQPFAELDADQRVHDLQFDRFGLERDSDGRTGKLGTSFFFSPILTGTLALGYTQRDYRDPTLPAVQGATFDGSLVWLATALTGVKLAASTVTSETVLAGVSGVFTHELSAEVDHAFRRWLEAAFKVTLDRDDYVGSARVDNRFSAGAALTYKLTREVWLRGELRRDWLASNIPGNDYQAYVAMLTLRLQR